MSQKITISSVTANTPVDIYYCDSMSANCVYVSTVAIFPYEFQVPAPYDETNFVIKVIDNQSCIYSETVLITPTPTPSPTLTPTSTSTQTPTNSQTPTNTPTNTTSTTQTPTNTPTYTPTPTSTPIIASHLVGKSVFTTSATTCLDTVSSTSYYTYISQSNLIPVSGATVYQYSAGGTLFSPLLIGGNYVKMKFGNDFYIVQINPAGQIINFQICP